MRVKYVSKNTALNPVARAMAQKKLADDLTTRKIKLYMMQDGEPCADLLEQVLMVSQSHRQQQEQVSMAFLLLRSEVHQT